MPILNWCWPTTLLKLSSIVQIGFALKYGDVPIEKLISSICPLPQFELEEQLVRPGRRLNISIALPGFVPFEPSASAWYWFSGKRAGGFRPGLYLLPRLRSKIWSGPRYQDQVFQSSATVASFTRVGEIVQTAEPA